LLGALGIILLSAILFVRKRSATAVPNASASTFLDED